MVIRFPVTHFTTRGHLGSRIVSGQGHSVYRFWCIAAADCVAPGTQLGRDIPEDELFVPHVLSSVGGSDYLDGVKRGRSLERNPIGHPLYLPA